MKHLQLITIMLVLMFSTRLFAQGNVAGTTAIRPISICVSTDKTTNLVFPFSIKSVDRGSAIILAQKAAGADNILQVKAANGQFPETNLSVITADGGLYSFLVCYNVNPSLNVVLASSAIAGLRKSPGNLPTTIGEATIRQDAEAIAAYKLRHKLMKDERFDAKLELDGIYVHDDVFYFRIKLENKSQINYTIDALRLFIRDRQKAKRTAVQEIDLQPLYIAGNNQEIKAATSQIVVLAVPKFTIPDKKYAVLQLLEKNGGRHLDLKMSNKTILKAKPALR